MVKGISNQKVHYNKIQDDYDDHYFDATSIEYRKRFLLKSLFNHINLNNKKVAEFACGSGFNSLYLKKLYPLINIEGFDISKKACNKYKKIVQSPVTCIDITKKFKFKYKFDVIVIIGGLHHCVSNLNQTLNNIDSNLNPGGFLLMMEPNADFFLNNVRKLWYKKDKYFEETTEHALSHNHLFGYVADKYECTFLKYLGGPAYFLILNSLILRVPIKLKLLIKYPLFIIEKLFNLIASKSTGPVFVASWRKLK